MIVCGWVWSNCWRIQWSWQRVGEHIIDRELYIYTRILYDPQYTIPNDTHAIWMSLHMYRPIIFTSTSKDNSWSLLECRELRNWGWLERQFSDVHTRESLMSVLYSVQAKRYNICSYKNMYLRGCTMGHGDSTQTQDVDDPHERHVACSNGSKGIWWMSELCWLLSILV